MATIFAISPQSSGLLRSLDDGQTWSFVPGTTLPSTFVPTFSPGAGGLIKGLLSLWTLDGGTGNMHIFTSADLGKTWIDRGIIGGFNFGGNHTQSWYDPAGAVVQVMGSGQEFASSDGISWTNISAALGGGVEITGIHRLASGRFIAVSRPVGSSALFTSDDGGFTWTQRNNTGDTNVASGNVTNTVCGPLNDKVLFSMPVSALGAQRIYDDGLDATGAIATIASLGTQTPGPIIAARWLPGQAPKKVYWVYGDNVSQQILTASASDGPWTLTNPPLGVFPAIAQWGYTYKLDSGAFLCHDTIGQIFRSTDGLTWSKVLTTGAGASIVAFFVPQAGFQFPRRGSRMDPGESIPVGVMSRKHFQGQ